MIRVETFKKAKEELYGFRKFEEKQEAFFNFALKTINENRETDTVTVFPARCGLGKSTFLRILVKAWLIDNPGRGLIIVTDNLDRLKEYRNLNDENKQLDKNKQVKYPVAYLDSENYATVIKTQNQCPILLISTQRYFQMDTIAPFLSYFEGGKEYRRDTVIFDEAPYFYENGEVGIDELDYLNSALNGGITDLSDHEDKAWLVEQYSQFREKMIELLNSLEQKRNRTTYLYYQPCKTSITDDDRRLYAILDKSDVYTKYRRSAEIIKNIQQLLLGGGFFTSFKLSDNNNYKKCFLVRRSFVSKFYLDRDIKTFIFDATAAQSENYYIDADWLDELDCDSFCVPLDYMTVHVVDVNTSRNALLTRGNREAALDAIRDYIASIGASEDDTLFVTYKALLDAGAFDEIGFTADNSRYFGNVKGFNQDRDKHTYIQVGLNRQTDINYVFNLFENEPAIGEEIKRETDVQKNIAAMDSLLSSDLVNSYMCAEVIADFVQNLFRIKAREINNRDKIEVYLFCKNTENIIMELQYALGRHGAKIEVVELTAMQDDKIIRRKGNSRAKRIVEWLTMQHSGQFEISDLLNDLEMTQSDFDRAKKGNRQLREHFQRMKVPGTKSTYHIG